ncbi:mitochondrial matrix Mmp37-domain-containing protein [Entophlyctis helioformis]|nr:mitochondrial matrix Mmp37-domain-containing protein [Entophlyctis helioformis]
MASLLRPAGRQGHCAASVCAAYAGASQVLLARAPSPMGTGIACTAARRIAHSRLFGATAHARTMSERDTELTAQLESLIGSFQAPVRFALAYGSGVYQQQGYSVSSSSSSSSSSPSSSAPSGSKPMIDFIFGVTHPEHWHSLNIRQNRHHYSSLAGLGSGTVAQIQDSFGAGIYFNPDIDIDGARVKYGVIKIDRLIKDLEEWESLYIAGRMQKPVKILRDDARIRLASQTNRYNAVRAALLMLPHQFSEEDLFLTIAGLSYRGDFRMRFGENPYKIYNIVYAQMDAFRQVYKPIIEDLPIVNYVPDGSLQQEDNAKLRASMVLALPKRVYERIKSHHLWYLSRKGKLKVDRADPMFALSVVESPELPVYVEKALAEIVAMPALTQSLKASFVYAGEKVQKMFAGKKPTKE